MKNTDIPQEATEKQKDKPSGQQEKAQELQADKKPQTDETEGEDDENPFGGISSRNLKKNLGCGG